MKTVIVFKFLLITLTKVHGKINLNSDRNLEIPQFISAMINQANEKDPSSYHDVVLIRLENGDKSEIFDDIKREILSQNPTNAVFSHENTEQIKAFRVHTASFIIIASDNSNPAYLENAILNIFSLNYWTNSAKFFFVPTSRPFSIKYVFNFFDAIGVTNAVLLFIDEVFVAVSANRFLMKGILYRIEWNSSFDSVFPDKINNLNGYAYKLILSEHPPRLTWTTEFFGIDIEILAIIAKKQNANLKVEFFIDSLHSQSIEFARSLMNQKEADLVLSSTYSYAGDTVFQKLVNTYDQNGFCALIPIPSRLTFLDFLLTPYDSLSWSLMFMSIAVCGLVWKLLQKRLNNSNSALHFVFGVIANFLGQSIPFRHNRRIQVFLLQLCILMTFIMGNVYQSIIIAFMISSRDGIRFKTFDELFDSDLKMKVDVLFYRVIERSGEFPEVLGRMEIGREIPDFQQLAKQNYAMIARCDMIKFMYDDQTKVIVSDHFYLLSETTMPFYETIRLAPLSPFYHSLQMSHDYVFESGIRQHWLKFWSSQKRAINFREVNYIEKEKYLLTIEDVYGVFYILLVGYGIALLVFLVEIFWNECLSRIDFKNIVQKFTRRIKFKNRHCIVRQIEVRPAQFFEETSTRV